MKSRTLTCVTAITLFAALAIPIQLAAQRQTTNFRHYKLVDIGTFGGPASFINPPSSSVPAVSSRGMIVGASATLMPTTPTNNFFECGGLDGSLPFVFHAFARQQGDATDLGALTPVAEDCSNANSVNTSGEIAGASERGVIDPVLGIKEIRAVRWKDGKIENLGTLGGNHSAAAGINDRGQIVGFALNKTPDPFSVFDSFLFGSSSGTQTRAFLWQNGYMQDLGTLGGPDAWAFYVNDRGQIAGFSYTNSTPDSATGLPTIDPFLWESGGMIDLGALGGAFGMPNALNNRGQVVGQSSLASDPGACLVGDAPNCHPFLWDEGKLIDLTVETRGLIVTANALNDAGEIVGNAVFPSGASDAYLWKDGGVTDLGTLAGDCFSEAFAINSSGQVVGQSFNCVSITARTFLWENGSIVDLNALIPSNFNLQLIEVFAINDDGEIGGVGNPPGCANPNDAACGHALLLIPVCADGTEGCADAPLDPSVVAQSRAESAAPTKTMTAEELTAFKRRIAGMSSWNRLLGAPKQLDGRGVQGPRFQR